MVHFICEWEKPSSVGDCLLEIQNGCISECCIVLYSMHIVCGCIYQLSVLFYIKKDICYVQLK